MGDLELVARLDNRLLLRDEAGAEYRLPICPKLKSLVYSGQATPQYPTVSTPIPLVGTVSVGGQKLVQPITAEVKGVGAEQQTDKVVALKVAADGEPMPRLRPAELQIRLRAGDTPEQLAEFSELNAAQIARFAGPIEAERADTIRAMRRMRVLGDGGTSADRAAAGGQACAGVGQTVGDLVMQRLGARGINSEQMTWQARRDVGTPWLIELRYDDGGRTHSARWTFDLPRRLLTALDEEARWLSSAENPAGEAAPIVLHQAKRPAPVRPVSDGGRRHASVFHDDGPQVSGAPIALPNRFAASDSGITDDGSATAVAPRPDLRPVAGLHPDAPAPRVKSVAPEPDVAGIVPINHWKSEKLETIAMAVTTEVAEAPAPTGPAATTAAPAKRSNAMADALNLNPKQSGKNAPADMLFESTATGSNPVISRRGRASVPSVDQIFFGAKD